MKKISLVFSVAALGLIIFLYFKSPIPFTSKDQTAAIVGSGSSLLGWFSLDEGSGSSAGDSSGSGYVATLTNNPTWVTGRIGTALSFDGVDDYAVFGPGYPSELFDLSQTYFTVSLWAKVPSLGVSRVFVNKKGNNNRGWFLGMTADNAISFGGFSIYASTGQSASQVIKDTEWHHISLVRDGSTYRLYVDGSLIPLSITPTAHPSRGSATLTAGASSPTTGTPTNFFQYSLDDLRIYNRALSASEISELYAFNGTTGSSSGSVVSTPTTPAPIQTNPPVSGGDTTPPSLSSGSPAGNLPTGTGSVTLTLSTNENAQCKYDTSSGIPYASMGSVFSTTGGLSHSTVVSGLTSGNSYVYRVRCQDVFGNASTNDFSISFSVSSAPVQVPASISGAGTSVTRKSGGVDFTWEFNCEGKPCRYGTFVNGDYWVAPIDDSGKRVSAVTITNILPAGITNGAEVNPSNPLKQGILTLRPYSYDANLNIMTKLPYKALPGQSIFKASVGNPTGCRDSNGCVASDDVLTVLSDIPPNNGATVFRPPFHGSWKPLFTTDKVRLDRLSSLPEVTSALGASNFQTSVATIVKTWTVPMYELGNANNDTDLYRITLPLNVVPNYGAYVSSAYLGGVLNMLGTESPSAKATAVYALMQRGIDAYGGMFKLGIPFGSGAGQKLGKKPAVAFFAALYDDPSVLSEVRSVATNPYYLDKQFFQEDAQIYRAQSGAVIWGEGETGAWGEATYWLRHFAQWAAINKGGTGYDNNGAGGDPYGYIDGPAGGTKITSTQGRNYQPVAAPYIMKYGFILSLMPWYRYANGDDEIIEYTDRLQGRGIAGFSGGYWSKPDVCAEVDSREILGCNPQSKVTGCLYYKVTWGPDPANPGKCIMHNGDPNTQGRWANQHGNTVYKLESTTGVLWTKLRDCTDPAHSSYPCRGLGPEGPDGNPPIVMHQGKSNTSVPTTPSTPTSPVVPPTTPVVTIPNQQASTSTAQSTYTVTVSRSGLGLGTISGPGISCGVDCSEVGFAKGTSVTLKATAGQGSLFTGWSGGVCSGTSSCVFTVSSSIVVTASFVDASSVGTIPQTAPSTSEDVGVTSVVETATSNSELGKLVELLISLGVIRSDKVSAARTFAKNNSSATVSPTTSSAPASYCFLCFLYQGSRTDVILLQTILAKDKTVYPEGIINGNFGPLTKRAVQRFQIKYEIANPTHPAYGIVGPITRGKLLEVYRKQP